MNLHDPSPCQTGASCLNILALGHSKNADLGPCLVRQPCPTINSIDQIILTHFHQLTNQWPFVRKNPSDDSTDIREKFRSFGAICQQQGAKEDQHHRRVVQYCGLFILLHGHPTWKIIPGLVSS